MTHLPRVNGSEAASVAKTETTPVDRAALAKLMTAARTAEEARKQLTVKKSGWVGAGMSRLTGATAKAETAIVQARRAFEQELAKPLAKADLRFRNNWITHNNLLAARDAVSALEALSGRPGSERAQAAAITTATAAIEKAGLGHELEDFRREAHAMMTRRGDTDRGPVALSVGRSIEVALATARRAVEPALKKQATTLDIPFSWESEPAPGSFR